MASAPGAIHTQEPCRRRWGLVLVLLLLAWPARAQPGLNLAEVAPGVHVHIGRHEESNASNEGDLANIGFIVGERCVAVVDTGGSRRVGEALRAAIRTVTPKPVCYVINTHVHPDHTLGNAAFRGDAGGDGAPEFVGHHRLPLAMATRGPNYLNALRRDVPSASAGTEIVPPSATVQEKRMLDLGGRVLELRAWPTAHTDNDLTVLDVSTGTLWLGDLVFMGHVPSVDGSLRGWLKVLDVLAGTPALRVIPGHGPAFAPWPAAAVDTRQYLQLLLAETRAAIQAGRTLRQATDEVGRSEHTRWELFESFHRRNVTAAYAELEWE